MDTLNNNPEGTESIPTPVAPIESTPEAIAAPLVAAAPTPAPVAPTPAPAPAAPRVKMELPKTDGNTVGGWNRFAGYNPNAAKSKQKDGRGGSGGRGR